MAKPWKSSDAFAPTTIHEICRRYVATAATLAKVMGLPLSEAFIKEHRESIACCFIESGRAGVRLPASVTLLPLAEQTAQAFAPVTPANGQGDAVDADPEPPTPAAGDGRLSRDAARELKKAAQAAYGFVEGERRLRQNLGLAADARLTLMRISAHTTAAQYARLHAAYEAALRQAVEADVPR